jgi:hypothetical protein
MSVGEGRRGSVSVADLEPVPAHPNPPLPTDRVSTRSPGQVLSPRPTQHAASRAEGEDRSLLSGSDADASSDYVRQITLSDGLVEAEPTPAAWGPSAATTWS